ncbi:hypothetical protein EDD17DRAFT_1509762 [Pisolithus thermaeus]|nr:hypothetical protein EDD17DRAFT_1509762 [Pisolithus thermaeus]
MGDGVGFARNRPPEPVDLLKNTDTTRRGAAAHSAMRETKDGVKTVLFKVSNKGELIAAVMVSVTVGLLLNPFSVLDACFESELYSNKKPESAHSPRSARHDSSKLGQAYREVCPKWNTKTNKLSGHHEESYVFEVSYIFSSFYGTFQGAPDMILPHWTSPMTGNSCLDGDVKPD